MNAFDYALSLLANEKIQTIPMNEKVPMMKFADTPITQEIIKANEWKYQRATGLGVLCRGVWCIDVDVDHESGKNGFENLKQTPFYDELADNARSSYYQTTPRGGRHFIFKKRKGIEYSQKLDYIKGLDVKANDNNYFMYAGSVTNKGIYKGSKGEVVPYNGEFEKQIFKPGKSYKTQIENELLGKYNVHDVLLNHGWSESDIPVLKGRGGAGKEAYQRIIEGVSDLRNDDLYKAVSYAKACDVSIQPLEILIGTKKGKDVFTEKEFWKTVESAMRG